MAQHGRVEAVKKATELLACFTPHSQVLSIRSLSRLTGYPRSTVHELCATLCEAGYLVLVPGRGYALGEALVALGGQVMHRHNIIDATEGLLAPLVVADETWVLVGQLVGGWIVYLVRHVAPRHGRVNSRTGLRVPAHRTACGKAALALLPAEEARSRIVAACEADRMPLPDFAALERDFAVVRDTGFIVSADWRPGRVAIGAPLIEGGGAVVGGISVGGPAAVLDENTMRRAAVRIVPIAERIGMRLRDDAAVA